MLFTKYFGKKKIKKNKITYLLGDLHLNLLDRDTNWKVKYYCNTFFSHNFMPIINKTTSFTHHNAIYH